MNKTKKEALLDKILSRSVKDRLSIEPIQGIDDSTRTEYDELTMFDDFDPYMEDSEAAIHARSAIDEAESYEYPSDSDLSDPAVTICGLDVTSSYLNKKISHNDGPDSSYVSSAEYKPAVLEYDSNFIEIRTTAINVINLYDIENGTARNIVSPFDRQEAVIEFEVDGLAWDEDYDDGYDDYDNPTCKMYCIIPREENISRALKENSESLKEYGIDINDMTGRNTKVYIDGEEMKFKDEALDRNIVDLLEDETAFVSYDTNDSRSFESSRRASESRDDDLFKDFM